MSKLLSLSTGLLAVIAVSSPALAVDGDCDAGCATPNNVSGAIELTGATLFFDFYGTPASTTDFIDANQDGICGRPGPLVPPQQLAATGSCSTDPNFGNPSVPGQWWYVNARGVGSGNGIDELLDFACTGVIPTDFPSEGGRLNRFDWYTPVQDAPPLIPCGTGTWPTGSPIVPLGVDAALSDVPFQWFTQGVAATPAWFRQPGQAGYGASGITACPPAPVVDPNDAGLYSNDLIDTPCTIALGLPVVDTEIAWVPIAYIANRGTGLENIALTEVQHLFVTGRLPNGEDLAAITRDVGSGTRNGAMNSACIDPSWGVGDNCGPDNESSSLDARGPRFHTNNKGGSSRMEGTVQNNGLGVGYTGLVGGSRAAADTAAGRYEVLNVINDLEGGTEPVRPTLSAILQNTDPNTGWVIGGPESFITVGDPNLPADPNNPAAMANGAAADYINNIKCSIASTVAGDTDPNGLPGEVLSTQFFLLAAIDRVHNKALSPCGLVANTNFNAALQADTLINSTYSIGAFGDPDGPKVPSRNNADARGGWTDGNDGTVGGYISPRDGTVFSYGADNSANTRNHLTGDFNNDGMRNVNDIPALMAALVDPANIPGSTDANPAIPEIMGDYNADGNFDAGDVCYHANGLSLDPNTGALNRKLGYTLVDQNSGSGNYFNVTLATGKTYVAGDARGDVAGAVLTYDPNDPNDTLRCCGPCNEGDGVVDAADIDYVYANFGDFTNLDEAALMDLGADQTGDLVVDMMDITELVEVILGTQLGDVDLDGDVDADDESIVQANQGQSGLGYAGGDINGDGIVDGLDLAFFGPACLCGDVNNDGSVNAGDIDCFVMAVVSGMACDADCSLIAADTNDDGSVNAGDIDTFVEAVVNGACQ